ncbi:MAG: hypothetical protein ABUL77_03965 [Bacteroidota bacterium]
MLPRRGGPARVAPLHGLPTPHPHPRPHISRNIRRVRRSWEGARAPPRTRTEEVPVYYGTASYGNLPNSGAVQDAIVDLLRQPTTNKLPNQWTLRRGEARHRSGTNRR